jgi:hypothetical protein
MRRGNGAGQNTAKDLVSIVASVRVSCKDICIRALCCVPTFHGLHLHTCLSPMVTNLFQN